MRISLKFFKFIGFERDAGYSRGKLLSAGILFSLSLLFLSFSLGNTRGRKVKTGNKISYRAVSTIKKRLGSLLAAAVLFLSVLTVFTPVESVSAASKIEAKVTASILNVRAKASASSKITGKLKKGTAVTISKESGKWANISSGKISGWVSTAYLSKMKKTSAAASVASVKNGYVTATSLNIRKSASATSSVLASLKKDTLVNIKSTKGTWMKVYVPSTRKPAGFPSPILPRRNRQLQRPLPNRKSRLP